MANRRVNNVRTVSYGSGGLNERFSKIIQTALSSRIVTTASDTTNNQTSGSVFSRLRGAKKVVNKRPEASNIQNRLGKKVGGNIQKKKVNKRGNTNSMQGVERQRNIKRSSGKKQNVSKRQQTNKKDTKKLTAEELDKALDSYMMKDPKTAQAKLDAELTAYMDEAPDILMDETL
ncbi:uncharacterized protein BX663DRAFT_81704 [Cokeromyces recurvatus]|uniref:uncharacterized protein n=1 Tax=Cokeromyces recurvatus TaxID=90255 RepID=UPI00221E598F|nr:uncharacterized protein BX663DRAFT_81704 [Cokeromyces recurvatus]KAI7902102.1 hypothetical protein BX663DRAFT_81704 [Cokeromyces recurvatus]